MSVLRLILGDQLSRNISSLSDVDRDKDTILMCEVMDEATYVKHHKKKIAFIFSAMRHFADELRAQGMQVRYVALDNSDNSGSFKSEVRRALSNGTFDKIVVTHPGEYRVLQDMQSWADDYGVPVDIRNDDRFLATTDLFADWADGRKQLRMEYFYRDMRKKYGILMDGENPVGGEWNYDSENRKPPKDGLDIPDPYKTKPDKITQEVIDLVASRFSDHFGKLDGFHYAVTADGAQAVFDDFLDRRLCKFGDYQDAMLTDEPWMYHAHIALYLNTGLLDPKTCIERAEQAYHDGEAPLNAVEGFIRQILGWREYVRGLYWLKMPEYADENYLNAKRDLPALYWGAETQMNCLRQCVKDTENHAYAHHIQRLMVLGNFALLIGAHPDRVNEWYLIVYADAYEWVEMPNVTGMILFADGGVLASKPYAASGSYINKMSDYCAGCSYSVTKKNGPKACPFNYLYWDFLARHRETLKDNHRLRMIYSTYDKMDDEKKQAIRDDTTRFLKALD